MTEEIYKTYLIAYNCNMIMGWSSILFMMIGHIAGISSTKGLYTSLGPMVKIFQTGAVLEVLHVAIGIVKSNLRMTFFQVFSRLFVVWGIMQHVPEAQENVGVVMFLVAWVITEIIRYTYYFCMLLSMVPYYLMWARYSLFVGLYPLGVTGELLCMFRSLPYISARNTLSLSLPNRLNVSFSFYYFLIAVMLSYIPIFPQLFGRMLSQRKRVLAMMARKRAEMASKKE
ncbi:Hypothetical predicted protein [Octopus vulgaris]|uniref:Uncharacterized protein n=2 Tax=Octopus TaxID=6643 RepID=A0AA36F1G2_OCTVU|nr:very-long-chain (3R)-3-hydroxyacyl-CoA dehydratase 2 [Octopus sinensis]CAI9721039.1 Hypothetical predicted protein [Octopus vulgaris]